MEEILSSKRSGIVTSILIPYILISLAVLILYSAALRQNFISDDFSVIERMKNTFNLYDVFISDFLVGDSYRPLMQIIYAISYSLFNLNPVGYHVISLILFILNNILLYDTVKLLI